MQKKVTSKTNKDNQTKDTESKDNEHNPSKYPDKHNPQTDSDSPNVIFIRKTDCCALIIFPVKIVLVYNYYNLNGTQLNMTT